ncbi:hypothetical protein BU16DRAFT_318283 [Lophium mytilinum]|uniref:Uncharacterized protein n=1 Tax=Lophium mytilinum TaxID=390894 RepID=A0A6A6QZ67_9PEZI|nr:hypothetical protein BU16DRAFT_318283 [Lophium mytilinum]
MDEEQTMRQIIRRLQRRVENLERDQDEALERLAVVAADLHEVKWTLNDSFRALGELVSNRPSSPPAITPEPAPEPVAAPALESSPVNPARPAHENTPTPNVEATQVEGPVAPEIVTTARFGIDAIATSGVATKSNASTTSSPSPPFLKQEESSNDQAAEAITISSDEDLPQEAEAVVPEPSRRRRFSLAKFGTHSPSSPRDDYHDSRGLEGDYTDSIHYDTYEATAKLEKASPEEPQAVASSSRVTTKAPIPRSTGGLTPPRNKRAYMSRLENYEIIMQVEQDDWREYHCFMCGGNGRKTAASPDFQFLKGIIGIRNHLRDVHSIRLNTKEAMEQCLLRKWPLHEIESLVKGSPDARAVSLRDCAEFEVPLADNPFLVQQSPTKTIVTGSTAGVRNHAVATEASTGQNTLGDDRIEIPEWLGCIIPCADGTYAELRCAICGANTRPKAGPSDEPFYFKGIHGLRYHLEKEHRLFAPTTAANNWVVKLCARRVVPEEQVMELVANGKAAAAKTIPHKMMPTASEQREPGNVRAGGRDTPRSQLSGRKRAVGEQEGFSNSRSRGKRPRDYRGGEASQP